MPMSVHERLPDVRIEANGLLGRFLLAFPSHEIPLDVCDNSLALGFADLGYSLGVHMEAAVSQSHLVRVCDHATSIYAHDRVAVLMHVTVNADQLANGEFGFEGLLHDGMDSSNSLLGCKGLSNFHPITPSRSLGRTFRPAVMDAGERLPVLGGYCIGSVSQKVCHDDALGIDLGLAVLVAASDLRAFRHGILPIDLPDLHTANRFAIVPHDRIAGGTLDLGHRIEEGAQLGPCDIEFA